ncbi:hypothetical protein [Undibacterium sp.]|jgi:hypothetical protein|uniref:hypothetical protein n=1 Tax=Undibacterium sp. TaxID=1914977 RepID=UPI002C2E8CC1|nr:hypothetical protein [Undibacterium sp.]HTD03094.1 hypothetical protein [Undibacterium sp.]
MIDIVVIVILLGLLIAVLTSTIPPRQEGMPEYRFKRVARHGVAADSAESSFVNDQRVQQNNSLETDAGGRG